MGFFKKIISSVRESQNELLDWQNAVMADKSHKLYANTQQLEAATVQIIKDSIRIFDDSSRIINTTTKPDVFFSRLELAESKLYTLKRIEPYLYRVKAITVHSSPALLLEEFKSNKDAYIDEFITRSYNAASEKADSMKTEKGKQNQYKKYFESLLPFYNQMREKNIQYIRTLKNRHKAE